MPTTSPPSARCTPAPLNPPLTGVPYPFQSSSWVHSLAVNSAAPTRSSLMTPSS